MAEAFGTAALIADTPGLTPRAGRRAVHRFLANRLAVAAALVLLALVLFSVVGPHLWRWDQRVHAAIPGDLTPRWSHPFGTSRAGQDVLGEVMRGTQRSLEVGAVAGLLTTVLGTLWGALAGYFRGWVDAVLMRIVDVVLVLPLLVVVLVLAGASNGTTWWDVALVVGAFGWAGTARVVRSIALAVREREFVEAARSMGAGHARVLLRHVIPHAAPHVVVEGMLSATAAILIEAALSYLGFGIAAPDTSLGLLVADAQSAATTRPWLFYFPGGFLVLLCLAVHLVGDGVRDAVDPR